MRLWSHLGLGAICLGLGPVGLVSGLGPLRLVETFFAGACRAYCSRAIPKVSGLDILDSNIFHNLYISELYILYEL